MMVLDHSNHKVRKNRIKNLWNLKKISKFRRGFFVLDGFKGEEVSNIFKNIDINPILES